MRVFVSADLEGVNGVVLLDQVLPTSPAYAQAREWMIQEVNAAIEGAVQGGAREVIVNDAHHTMTNLLIDRLHPKATLLSGTRKLFSMMEGIEGSVDAAFFIGYHAKTGTEGAVLDHTFAASVIHDVRVNDVSVGEFGLSAGMAGHFGVPAVLVTGDRAVVQEAKALVPTIEAVVVKEGLSRTAARCYPFARTLEDIRLMAKRAVQHLEDKQPLKFAEPVRLAIEFQKTEQADLAASIPGMQRQGGCTVVFEADDFATAYRAFVAAFRIANQ
ncbi:MAG: M55 family metallopeptidase [candidate division KSB1 bacterium]|nr:M55 family metallopeptidase [candidate division KSB1 bacterium]MDZ7294388.1 M55 family metallopeptidase [candidate division KSB1 bacterium]MDZ7378712.1 M55 family metallopeptidase [candidate division KSB1 bacterium]MDZ7394002.1 M55 family metallopeptidase [candidate division KSB1 bacterium]MDZ7414513.1 M55 family metallopeptidase [candidate division KSB1 bacterium]